MRRLRVASLFECCRDLDVRFRFVGISPYLVHYKRIPDDVDSKIGRPKMTLF